MNKHYSSIDSEGACKEIQDLRKIDGKKKQEDMIVIVVFFDSKNL